MEETDSLGEKEEQYQARNENIQYAIDTLASYRASELDKHGRKSEIAEEHDISYGRVHYVLDRWEHLIQWRRAANTSPLDEEAVKEAYDDDTMEAMAGTPMADGASNVMVPLELTLDEAFRAVKLLPGDLGMKVYVQTLEADLPRSQIQRIFEADE